MQAEAKPEQLGFRCEKISQWHRTLGYDMPATDLDFLMLEYDKATPKALIEYKHENAARISTRSASLLATARLATAARLPFFVVRYTENCTSFAVIPCNDLARKFVPGRELMSEVSFTKLLERLRK